MLDSVFDEGRWEVRDIPWENRPRDSLSDGLLRLPEKDKYDTAREVFENVS